MPLLAIAFVFLVVAYVIMSFLVKTPKNKPAALEEWDFPRHEEGTPHTVVFGDAWLTGPMVLWYGNYKTKKIKAEGGKGK